MNGLHGRVQLTSFIEGVSRGVSCQLNVVAPLPPKHPPYFFLSAVYEGVEHDVQDWECCRDEEDLGGHAQECVGVERVAIAKVMGGIRDHEVQPTFGVAFTVYCCIGRGERPGHPRLILATAWARDGEVWSNRQCTSRPGHGERRASMYFASRARRAASVFMFLERGECRLWDEGPSPHSEST